MYDYMCLKWRQYWWEGDERDGSSGYVYDDNFNDNADDRSDKGVSLSKRLKQLRVIKMTYKNVNIVTK